MECFRNVLTGHGGYLVSLNDPTPSLGSASVAHVQEGVVKALIHG